jgi:hypothetical protein
MLKNLKWKLAFMAYVPATVLIPNREGVPTWLAYSIIASLPVALLSTLIYRKVTNQEVDSVATEGKYSPLRNAVVWILLAVMAVYALREVYFTLVAVPRLVE